MLKDPQYHPRLPWSRAMQGCWGLSPTSLVQVIQRPPVHCSGPMPGPRVPALPICASCGLSCSRSHPFGHGSPDLIQPSHLLPFLPRMGVLLWFPASVSHQRFAGLLSTIVTASCPNKEWEAEDPLPRRSSQGESPER